jgi:MoaA/NifB/PqqE/SkfB family radical SAM enzyme
MGRRVGNMNMATFRRIIDEAAKHGLQSIWLHVLGEPLLNPQIFEFVRYCKQFNNLKNIGFSTNGSYLDERKARELLSSGLDRLVLSLDGATKETYEAVRRQGNYEVVKANIERFLTLRKEYRPNLQVKLSIVDLKLTHPELRAFRDYWDLFLMNSGEILVKPFLNFGGLVDDSSGGNSDCRQNHRRNGLAIPCIQLWKNLTILWNGDVTVCCFDGNDALMSLGNVNDCSLQKLWLSQAQTDNRFRHLNRDWRKMPLCQSCSLSHLDLRLHFRVPGSWR